MGSQRAQPPPPLDLDSISYEKSKTRSSSSSSDECPTTGFDRKASSSSSASGRRKASSPTVNVYTTCGRHTDQYLFGGRSLSDIARSVWSNNRGQ